MPSTGGRFALVECKAGRTVTPAMAAPLRRLAEAMRRRRPGTAAMLLAYETPSSVTPMRALAPGVRALPWRAMLDELA